MGMKRIIVWVFLLVLSVTFLVYGDITIINFVGKTITWLPPLAPTLDTGYSIRTSATIFTVDFPRPAPPNTRTWGVSLSGSNWTRDGACDKPIGDLKWMSRCTDSRHMVSVTTHDTWQPLTSAGSSVASGTTEDTWVPGWEHATADIQMDYRLDLDWSDQAGTYAITLSYVGTDSEDQTTATETVDITVDVPTMQRLDVTGGFQWVIPTAAGLDYGYLERSAATAFSIWTNQQDWEMMVSAPSGWSLVPSGANIVVGDFKWKCHCVASGTMQTASTTSDWTQLTTTPATIASGSPGGNAQFLMDYRIDFDWKDPPGEYRITPTYQLGDESKDVAVTITNPTIQVLDLVGPEIQWVEVTSADLDSGYVSRSAATSFVVRSNIGWEVIVATGDDEVSGDVYYFTATSGKGQYGLPVTDLYWKSHIVDKGSFDIAPTVQEASWVTFDAATGACASKVATTTEAGADCVVMADYKIALNWHDTPDTYTITLTYTLQPSS